MSSYGRLASWYDSLTGDIPYEQFADLYEAEFRRDGGEFRLLLDLCCGTGSLTCIMSDRGYDMIAADASVDMLMQAREKSSQLTAQPLFLCQDAAELDLFGTVDAAFCSLDSLNYIDPQKLPEVFRGLRLFIRPGGLLIFDIKTPESLRSCSGQVFVDERDDVLCLWRADFDESIDALIYGMDIFSREGELWSRASEEHVEYAHEPQALSALLEGSGFSQLRLLHDCPQAEQGRLFISARRV